MTTSTTASSDISAALSNLLTCLHTLKATGEMGFEGLLRDLVADLTKLSFRLAKSGPQGGVDMRSQAANALQVGLESKQYASTTHLSLDDLKSKLLDAATQPDPVDVWVLAASRPITDTDARVLVTLGEQHGIAVVIIDWTNSPAALPRMAALCAAAPQICCKFLGDPPGLDDDLKRLAAHDDFGNQLKHLQIELSNPDIGYANATVAVRRWMEDAQSDEAKARARLQGPNNLTETGVVLVRRPAIFEALDGWWKNSAVQAAALVGQEGNGKTWAALAWGHALGRDAAMALFIPARNVSTLQLLRVIAEALAERTGIRTPDFWRKRLGLWANALRSAPPILIVLDGIDQNWTCNWADTIQPLLDPANAGLFRVLMTCRPDPWVDLGGLVSLRPHPQKIDAQRLSDSELDDLLTQAKLTRADFVPAVLELMRTPRLSLLAITQRDALAASGDVTAERLIYEDWKHRLGRRRDPSHFSDTAFQKFIQEIGRDLRNSGDGFTVTRRELLDRLTKDSGKAHNDLRTILSEIVDGRWLVADQHNEHKFRVDKNLVPYALGLALAGDLRGALTKAEVENRIADYLDPLKGQSLALSVLRGCATVALLDPWVERPARRGILERWVSEHNFSRNDFDALWRMVGLDLDLFCDFVEETWLTPQGGMFIDEILIKSTANAYEFPDVAPRLQARITKWLGWAWPDPFDGMFIGQRDLTKPESLSKQAKTRENLTVWRARNGNDNAWPAIGLRETGAISWFSHRVFGIMSYLSRAHFAEALMAWALSRAIMDYPCHFEELAWLLRLNRKDPAETRAAVFGAASTLRAEGSEIARRAAGWLLDALGDPEADALATEIRQELEQPPARKRGSAQARHMYEGYGSISPDETVAWDSTRDKIPDGRQLWLYPREQGQEDVRLNMVSTTLARTDPRRFCLIFTDAVDSAASRSDPELLGLARRVGRFMFLLAPDRRTTLRNTLLARAETVSDPETKVALQGTAQFIALWSRPAADQISIIAAALPNGLEGVPFNVFNRISDADWSGLRALIDSTTEVTSLRIWLQYLHRRASAVQAKDWPDLARLVLHSDDVIRQCALELTFNSRNGDALEAWAKSGWSVKGHTASNLAIYGSLALIAAQVDRGCVVAADRVSAEAVGFALVEQPADLLCLDAFEAFFRTQMAGLFLPGTRTIPQYWHDHILALRILFKARNDTLVPWVAQWLDAHPDLGHPALFDSFPLFSLCKVLLDIEPALGVRLWAMLRKKMDEGIFKRGDLRLVPLEANDSPEVHAARADALTELDTDMELFDFALTAQQEGRADWLRAEIRRRAVLSEPAERALAYHLAGYLDWNDQADDLWIALPAPPQTACWLAEVYSTARRSYERSRFAHHWHRQFIAEQDSARAFAALELFYASADGRSALWARHELDASRDSLSAEKRAHWWTNASRLDDAAKTEREAKKSLLFGARIMDQTQAPWL